MFSFRFLFLRFLQLQTQTLTVFPQLVSLIPSSVLQFVHIVVITYLNDSPFISGHCPDQNPCICFPSPGGGALDSPAQWHLPLRPLTSRLTQMVLSTTSSSVPLGGVLLLVPSALIMAGFTIPAFFTERSCVALWAGGLLFSSVFSTELPSITLRIELQLTWHLRSRVVTHTLPRGLQLRENLPEGRQ